MAAGHSVDVARWEDAFGEVIDRIAPRFARYEPLRHAASLIQGLLAPLERKNCWTIAEHRGDTSPDALQHLLGRAKWDADGVRDDLRGYVVEHLGDPGAVLVVDETGDVKKGSASVGVQRQYTGTAGRIENAQVAVYLTYAAPRGHAFIDRALYLPTAWTGEPERRAAAGVPAQVRFATKPALAAAMITRAVTAGVPAAWVAGDEVYGADPQLRATVRRHALGYVMQIAANRQVHTDAGAIRVDQLPARIPAHGWQIASAGAGSKGHRTYSWAWIDIAAEAEQTDAHDPHDDGQHGVLIRRNDTTGELAYHRCYAPAPTPMHTLIQVAGQRWRIEESFQAAKGLTGLDQHQVRRWTSWHRWTTLAMLAHAFLTVAAASERETTPAPSGLIALTVAEFRRLFTALLVRGKHTINTVLAWSHWRRQHQARARDCHYRRRELH
ncbi:MAG: IS701 family transposase [Dermatophilaceae bacterium]